MRRRRYWWRNPDPEEDLLDLQLPPDDDINMDDELLALGADVPPSVDELMHLDLPPEDYEIEVDFERPTMGPVKRRRGRPRKSEMPLYTTDLPSMTRESAEKLLARKRGRGRPSAELSAKLAAAREALGLSGRQRIAPIQVEQEGPSLWGSECVCDKDNRGMMVFSPECPTHEFLAKAVTKHKTQKARPVKASKPVKSNRKPAKLTKTEALKIVAQSAGKRGKRNKEFRAALKVLCKGAKRRRNRRRSHRRGR